MSNNNISKFLTSLDKYIANLNRVLKDIKLDTFIDFIRSNYSSLVIISNKVVSSSDLNIIESYIKNANSVNTNDVQSTYLPQSKLYLKILGILYLIKSTNIFINSNMMELIIKFT